ILKNCIGEAEAPTHYSEKALHQRQFRGGGGSDRGEPFGPAIDGYAGTRPQTLVRQTGERDGLSLSIPSEVEGDCGSGESPVDKANGKDGAQLDDAFLEDPDSDASSSEDELGPPCFCSTPIRVVEEDSEDDGYEEFRRRLGIELTEPVPHRERKKVLRTIVRVAVYAVLKHCLREKLFEDCEGCVIDAPGQRHHDCVTWTSVDINSKLRGLCAELCLESLLNTVVAIGYGMQCLCLTQEHLAQGVTLINAVQFSADPDRVLRKMTKPEDACLERYIDRLVRTKSYRTLLKKKTICKKSKRIKLENGEGTNMRYKTW
ncbi:uncharacterized protein LOC135979894, partial [Chrysemys picta bellii]|uniref:uncharacterized protein LOC135978897 n=1 Tax=Chrysemys picta bellii TaxID=8478 RepID=UPI0032B1FFAD